MIRNLYIWSHDNEMKANILNVTYAELKKNHFQMALVLTKNLHQYIHKESASKSW